MTTTPHAQRPTNTSHSEALINLCRLAMATLRVPFALLTTEDGGEHRVRAGVGFESGCLVPEASILAAPLESAAPFAIEELPSPVLGSAARSYLGVPIRLPDEKVIGTIAVLDTVSREFEESAIQLLAQIADCAGDLMAASSPRRSGKSDGARFHEECLSIEERLRAQVESARNSLEQFAYAISHDLREPIRGIVHYSDFLYEDCHEVLPAEAKTLLDGLRQMAARLDAMLDATLSYSRVASCAIRCEPTELDALVDQALCALSCSLEKGSVKISRSPLPQRTCDPALLIEVLRVLLDNAMRYNDRKQPHVWIDWDAEREVLRIRDDGIGVPEAKLERVFHMFKRLHVRGSYGDGIGAGLAIARRIVERNGGKLWLESSESGGVTACLVLPPAENPTVS